MLLGIENVRSSGDVLITVPPPSSDKRKWWLDHNASSQVEVPKPPGEGWMLNPNRPTNPFVPTDEPDWIKVTGPQVPTSAPGTNPSYVPLEKKDPPAPPPRRQQSENFSGITRELHRRATSASLDGKPKPPVPPKPSFMSVRGSVSLPPSAMTDDYQSKPKPLLPPRPQGLQVQHLDEPVKVGLLMDDDEGNQIVGGWAPLQPSKEL